MRRFLTGRNARKAPVRHHCALALEQLEDRCLLAGVPTASFASLPATVMIGEQAAVTVRFDNSSLTDTGYGPYVDVFLPSAGIDGATTMPLDGLSYMPGSATHLGAGVVETILTFSSTDANNNNIPDVIHPYAVTNSGAPLIIDAPAGFGVGDQLVVFQLPFGSFTPDQPPADIQFQAALSDHADLGTPLNVQVRGGFRYGNDPLDNPSTDPSLVGASATGTVTPTLISIAKSYVGPEDETATGPNFPRRYVITVDIAAGQTVTDLDVIDALPNNLAFLSVISTSPSGTTTSTPPVGVAANAPNNELLVNFSTVTGSTATNDVTVVFEYFVPLLDANGSRVINATTGDDVLSENNARAVGDWTPIDPRDLGGVDNAVADPVGFEHVLTDKSIAIQKSVAVAIDTGAIGPTPGDTLEYTLAFQISDYFAFQNLITTDIFSDGQRFDAGFVPRLSVNEHGSNSSGPMNAANYSVVLDSPGTGTTTTQFFISNELVLRGLDAMLLGGNIPAGGTGASAPQNYPAVLGGTTGTITFRTVIQQDFSDTFPSGDRSVDQGDVLTNNVTIAGNVLAETNLAPTGQTEADTSGASVVIVRGTLQKSIYAINGSTLFSSPVRVRPGDTVTYRLRYTLPISDFEDLRLLDYLPLPIFDATTVASFDATVSAAAPALGFAKFGPNETFFALSSVVPIMTTDAVSNSIQFNYNDFDTVSQTSTEIDLLLTVEVSDDPFADGLFLTNQVRAIEGSTNAGIENVDAIVQIVLAEPNLQISKGVVATDNANAVFSPAVVGPVAFSGPGSAGFRGAATINSAGLLANPINSNLSGLDAGDRVTFAIIVENIGSSTHGAFNVQVRDTLPAGFVIPGSGLNLQVTDGTGAAFTMVDLGGGLFGSGLELTDPGPTLSPAGALDNYNASNGRNVLVVTYDLEVATTITPNEALINTATLFNYSGTETGPDHTTTDRSDTARVTTANPAVTKTIVSTNQVHTTGNNVAIGELVQYQVTIQVPEGTSPAVNLVDTLDAGLAFVSLDSIAASAALSTSQAGGFPAILFGGVVAGVGAGAVNDGRQVAFNFGDIVNSNRDNTVAETITLTYTVAVINGNNERGDERSNSAVWSWTDGGVTANAPDLRIVEPVLQVDKDAVPSSADAGDVITYTLTVSHQSVSDTADAFNAALSDALPAGLTYVPGSLLYASGLAPTTLSAAGGLITATWTTFAETQTTVLQFQATVDNDDVPGSLLTNTAEISWTSLPGDVTTTQSPHNSLATERTGDTNDPGGADNDYRTSDDEIVNVHTNSISGRVYNDLINNGTHDVGDPPISGVTITLTGTDHLGNTVVRTTATLADGTYSFDNLRPGTYTVTETQPAGFVDGLDAVGTTFGGNALDDVINSIVIPTGASNTGTEYNFAEIVPASLSGYVYVDMNNNGDREPTEAGIANVPVRLTGTDFQGRPVDVSTTTLADGSYLFDNLSPGSYVISETQPAGYLDNPDDAGTQGGIAPQNDQINAINLAVGAVGLENNFGEIPPSSISGTVYIDSNRNGVMDGNERGFGNVIVTLTGTNDLGQAITITGITDRDGNYQFTNLRPGNYALTRTTPAGYTDGITAPGSEGGGLTAPNGNIISIPIGVGVDATDYLFSEIAMSRSKWYFLGAQAPVFIQQPQNDSVSEGHFASFRATVAGAATLSHQWQRLVNGEWIDVPGATAATLKLTHVAIEDNGAQFRLVSTNQKGVTASHAAVLSVLSNTAPTPLITSPSADGRFVAGKRYNFQGTANDLEDRNLPGSAYAWSVEYHHGGQVDAVVSGLSGVKRGSFTVAVAAAPGDFYRIILTVQDSNGAAATVHRDMLPQTVQVSILTNIPGLTFAVDGALHAVSITVTWVVGARHTLSAATTQSANGVVYVFESWSNRGPASHTVTAGKRDATYAANYRQDSLPLSIIDEAFSGMMDDRN